MKKFLILLIISVLLLSCIVTSSAYNLFDDVAESFIATDTRLYLTEETKAGDIEYFGERITLKDKNGNWLSADDYVTSGTELFYFGKDFWYTIILVGDADCNGKITAADARIALRISAGLYNTSENSDKYGSADANFNGRMEAADAREVLRKAAGLSNFELFKDVAEEHRFSLESEVPSDRDSYLVSVYIKEAYKDEPEWLNPEYYGDNVSSVKRLMDNQYVLYLKDASYEKAVALYSELVKKDSVIIGLYDVD